MNAQQAENLRILIRHMETLTRTLDMERVLNECGTPACAIGEACLMPELAARGLHPSKNNPGSCALVNGEEAGYHRAAQNFFGTEAIFQVAAANPWRRSNVTPQEWALEARKVLSEHGYSMDDDNTWAARKVAALTAEAAEVEHRRAEFNRITGTAD